MIPATYPSVLDSSNRTKMLVYQVPSITGLTRWVDYIPVKSPVSEADLTLANTYANEGFILTTKVNDITGLVPFKDYVPIYIDSTATKAWSADNDGYIPMSELAGLLLDFTTGSLDSRINFSRTSNATVTNSAGVISYAPHNLLTYSEQFDNSAWTVEQGALVANNITAPNGTLTAEKYTENALAGVHGFRNTTAVTVNAKMSASIYLKNGTRRWVAISLYDGATYFVGAVVDLTTGLITQTFGTWDSTPFTVDAGNGWYRVVVTKTLTTNTFVYVSGCDSSTPLTTSGRQNRTGDGTSYFYAWGAQLEIGSTATTYNSTTVKNLLGYSELFDNAAWTKSNSFVQTNLLTYSEAFDNAAWGKSNATVTSNNILAPNGYQTAEYIESIVGAFTQTYFRQNATVANATTYTQSVYAKKGTVNWLQISLGWASFVSANFNLDTGVLGTVSAGVTATITNVGNGWYRCTASAVSTATSGQAQFQVMSANNLSPSAANQGIYAWGAQLVQGATAGDYRRTDAATLPIYYANHNGVVCAEKLVENTATSEHRIQVTPTLGTAPITASIYFKASERSWAFIRLDDSISVKYAYFNLSTGIVGTVTAGLTASIVNAGNGWYRCSATFNAPSAGSGGILFAPTTGNGTSSYTGDGTSGIYIFGAQLSDSASLDPYVLNAATAPSAAAYYGARFDYDPVTLAPKGLLIEEQRANLLLNSSLAGTNLATQSVTVTAVAHTLSFYGTGTVTLTGTANTSLVGTGAYPTRSTLTFTPTAGVVLFTVTGTVQYAQLEIGSFATSFIPTAASQVTRTADVATIQGSNFYSWYRTDEGAFVADWQGGRASGGNDFRVGAIGANNSTTNFWIALNGDGLSMTTWFGGAAPLYSFTSPNFVTVGGKMGVSYSVAGILQAAGGTVDANDTSISTMPLVTEINLGARATTRINGTIKSLSYFPTRLNNDTLKGLTA